MLDAAVAAIYLAPTAGVELVAVARATLEPGCGIVGDRYYKQIGTFSESLKEKADWQVTLIELEEVDRFNAGFGSSLGPGSFRRNIVTRGVRLNEFVGRRFAIGEALLEGVRLCEPCAYLARLLGPDVMTGMVHKAGLRARVLSGATIKPGDPLLDRGATHG